MNEAQGDVNDNHVELNEKGSKTESPGFLRKERIEYQLYIHDSCLQASTCYQQH